MSRRCLQECLLVCHHLEQGGNKLSGRCSLSTPTLPTRGGKGRETYKCNIKKALLITLKILITLIIREIKYTKLILSFPEFGALEAGIPPAAARQHQEIPDWPQQ